MPGGEGGEVGAVGGGMDGGGDENFFFGDVEFGEFEGGEFGVGGGLIGPAVGGEAAGGDEVIVGFAREFLCGGAEAFESDPGFDDEDFGGEGMILREERFSVKEPEEKRGEEKGREEKEAERGGEVEGAFGEESHGEVERWGKGGMLLGGKVR